MHHSLIILYLLLNIGAIMNVNIKIQLDKPQTPFDRVVYRLNMPLGIPATHYRCRNMPDVIMQQYVITKVILDH